MNQLVKLAQKNDLEAFAELMRLCEQDMYRVARSLLGNDADIADAIQEAILSCFENLPSLNTPAYFKTWLLRILINKCNDILNVRRRIVPLDVLPDKGATDIAIANVEFNLLMDMLDEKYRTVLVLRYGEGLSVKQVAHALNISESAAKQRLKRGRQKAKKLFDTGNLSEVEVLA